MPNEAQDEQTEDVTTETVEQSEDKAPVPLTDSEKRKLHDEAKRYRLQLRETERKLEEAKTDAAKAKALEAESQKLAEENYRLVRAGVARDNNIPDELVSFLTGSSQKEMHSQAQLLASHLQASAKKAPKPAPRGGGVTDDAADDDDWSALYESRRGKN